LRGESAQFLHIVAIRPQIGKYMNIKILIPRIVHDYISSLPEVRHNAYKYFNYDNRVVNERVDRHDVRKPYMTAKDFGDMDYDALVSYARTLINPVLLKYSPRTANEDALSMAIRSFANGLFDGKVNANCYNVLLDVMTPPTALDRMAGKKGKKKPAPKELKPSVLRQMGLKQKDIPRKERLQVRERKIQKAPYLYREKGRTFVKDRKEN